MATPQFRVLTQLILILLTFSNVLSQISECLTMNNVFPNCSCEAALNDQGQETLYPAVDCSGLGLTQVPVPATSYTKLIYEVRLNNNTIVNLGSDILNNLQIRKLDFSGNAIRSVDNHTFRALSPHLMILHLDGDSASPPPKAAFLHLTSVEELVLRNFAVQDLDDSAEHNYFLPLTNLKVLTLDNWGILSIAENSFRGPLKLLSLSLLRQPMPFLPIDMLHSPELKELQELKISHGSLNELSQSAFSKLDRIQKLDLSHNQIDSLQDDCFMDVGDTLLELDLSSNILNNNRPSSLIGLKGLTNLEKLDMSSNLLRGVPDFSQLATTKMLKLHLNNNQITELQENSFVGVADKLNTLDLSENDIRIMNNNSFNGVTQLEVLSLTNSPHNTGLPLPLPVSLLGSKATLKQLYLTGQRISIPSLWAIIGDFTQLEVLDLAKTQLNNIPNMAFEALKQLKSLDLTENALPGLTQRSLIGPRDTLNQLYLSSNSISTLPSCLFYQYTSYPITMTLKGNDLECDCNLKWLWTRIKNATIKFSPGHGATCKDNQLLESKQLNDFCTGHHIDPPCEEHYTTPLTTTTTIRPPPVLSIMFEKIATTTITVKWTLSNTDQLNKFKVEVMSMFMVSEYENDNIDRSKTQETVQGLLLGVSHDVCVTAYFDDIPSVTKCDKANTLGGATTRKPEGQTGSDSEDIGIIVGAVIGGVVLLVIVTAIVYLVFIRPRPKKSASNNVSRQPRNFSKAELPSMSTDTRSFARPHRSANASAPDQRDGMQVVAISDGQTSNGRVGRAQMLTSDGSYKVMGDNRSAHPSSVGQSSYENDRGSLPPTPPVVQPPAYYNNDAFQSDQYDEVEPQKEIIL